MNQNNKTNWKLLGTIAGVCAAPFTGGTSLALVAAGAGLGLVGGSLVEATGLFNNNSDNNALNSNLEAWKIQNEQWKTQQENNRLEVERLRKEREDLEKRQKNNNDEIARINSIINNPQSTPEEKTNAKKRLIILGDENEKLKRTIGDLETKINDIVNNPPKPPSQPLGSYLPTLKFMDKIILAGGITLLVYLVVVKDDKKK